MLVSGISVAFGQWLKALFTGIFTRSHFVQGHARPSLTVIASPRFYLASGLGKRLVLIISIVTGIGAISSADAATAVTAAADGLLELFTISGKWPSYRESRMC